MSAAEDGGARDGGGGGYFAQSKDVLASLILVIPLLLVYQAGLLATKGATLNGADFASVVIVRRWGWDGLLWFNGIVIALGLIGVAVLKKNRRFDPAILGPILLESGLYAVLLGFVITWTLARLGVPQPAAILAQTPQGEPGVLASVCMALGAGVNEELVFRLGLLGGLVAILERPLGKQKAVLAGVLVSSVLFSLAHYLGPESFSLYSFLYRTIAGALFCGVFWTRGLAVAAYTHALYDVLVMVVLRH
jgi:membrane protease YdiL (CAAX protease family)